MRHITRWGKKAKAKVKKTVDGSDSSVSRSGIPDLRAGIARHDATTEAARESHVDNENTSDFDVGIPSNKNEVELKDQEGGASDTAKFPAQHVKQESLWARAYRRVEEDVDFSSYLEKYNDFVRKEAEKASETVNGMCFLMIYIPYFSCLGPNERYLVELTTYPITRLVKNSWH